MVLTALVPAYNYDAVLWNDGRASATRLIFITENVVIAFLCPLSAARDGAVSVTRINFRLGRNG